MSSSLTDYLKEILEDDERATLSELEPCFIFSLVKEVCEDE